jgi:hypothetical protein
MSIQLRDIYRFKANSTKILTLLFIEIEKTIMKFVWNHKSSQVAKAILSNKQKQQQNPPKQTKLRAPQIRDFKIHYKSIVIKATWYRHKNRYKDQWNRIESQKTSPCIYDQLIFLTKMPTTPNGDGIVS